MNQMIRRLMSVFLLAGLILLGSACGAKNDLTTNPDGSFSKDITADIADSKEEAIHAEEYGWPEGMPAEIPVLSAPVDSVMKGATHVRIFYSDVTLETFQTYLGQLKKAGCSLQSIVYNSNPTSDENAQARARRGEYDAVKTSIGKYTLLLDASGLGNGELFFDIDGFSEDALAQVSEVSWPAGWEKDVPEPDFCKLDRRGSNGATETEMVATCFYLDSDPAAQMQVYQAYVQQFLDHGYSVTEPVLAAGQQPNFAGRLVLSNGTVTITIHPGVVGAMELSVRR